MMRRMRSGVEYFYYRHSDGVQTPLGKSLPDALKRYKEADAREVSLGSWVTERLRRNIEYHVVTMERAARSRAKRFGLEYELEASRLMEMIESAGFVCSYSGHRFSMEKGTSRVRPWVPSIDRKNASGGYTYDNIRIVCAAVNLAINDFGEDVLADLFHAGRTGIAAASASMASS